MALRQLRLHGDEILRKKSKPVKNINAAVLSLLDDMRDTLHERNGLGLAAPQIGVLRRVAIIELDDVLYEMINPVITATEGVQRRNEACLSVPGYSGEIDRPALVRVEALNREGDTVVIEGRELLASALCHELDHLDGILYIDKALSVSHNSDDEDEIDA